MYWLWFLKMKNPNQPEKKVSDTFFSSKGHDVPALYSILTGLGLLNFELIHRFRKLGGLPGHPDINTPFIMTNTGSLGMGISKAKGMAIANRLNSKKGNFFILTGDGELQEGQIWESLQQAADRNFSEITVIVDHNKFQSDRKVSETSDLGELSEKFQSFGWQTCSCNGHDFMDLEDAFKILKNSKGPRVIIANTIKGNGVSFMKKTDDEGFYNYHSGAPSDNEYYLALVELVERINKNLHLNLRDLRLDYCEMQIPAPIVKKENLISAYQNELADLGEKNKDIVVLDADLIRDCGLLKFSKQFPKRFFECGIAEQDMVSMAGGLALRGKLSIVHSFASFLTSRANEQIYNNASEGKKIIYVGTLAGLLPATPGHSHQAVRDISCMRSIPSLTIIQPASEEQVRQALKWAVKINSHSTYLRLTSIPVEIEIPSSPFPELGCGIQISNGDDLVLMSYGPVMLKETIGAAKLLAKQDILAAVYNFPWLNIVNSDWIKKITEVYKLIIVVEDHFEIGGLGDLISARVSDISPATRVCTMGVKGLPACGQIDEVLKYEGLDADQIAASAMSLV
jgi:transketolase